MDLSTRSRGAPAATIPAPETSWRPRLAFAAGAYSLVAGVVTLIGWTFDLPRLTDWKNDGISMFPNTAICAIASGLAITLADRHAARPTALRVLGAFVALVGGLTLLEHLSGADFGLDTLLFQRSWGQTAAASPMRMGPPASLAFLSTGTALLLLTSGPRARRACAALGVFIVTIGMLSFTGHLYGASQMYMLPRLTGIAMHTALVVVALGIGLIASIPEHEPTRTLLGRNAAGALTRQALPLLVLLALTIGALRVFIERQGLVDGPFGTALRTVVELAVLTTLLWWAAARIRTHEQALRASEAQVRRHADQLAAFLDTAAIALHRVGPDGTILWANDAELEMLGYRRDEYVGRHIADFHVDTSVIADVLARLHQGEKLHEHPAQMRCRDGSIKDVLIDASVLWDEGRFVHTQCFTRDVTDKRHAEETRSRLAALVKFSDDAIIGKDLNGVITSWNDGAARLFGYTAAEAVGRSITMLIPQDRQDEEPGILERIRRGERIHHYETVRQRKDGTLLDISLTVSPIRGPRGQIVGASKIARDVTDKKCAEAQREELLRLAEQAAQEADAANRAKDEFLAMLGHELRNPLSAVRNAIVAAILDERACGRALEIARRQTDQLGRIVDDLLDVARITSGRVRLRKERTELSDILQRAVEGARPLMEERGHTLTVSLPGEAIHLDADPARVEQAVVNVLTNAGKYTDPGGAISLSAAREQSEAVVRVRDNGMGIAPEVLPRVFDLFTQGDRALDRAQGGLGIGLTLVRRIVELHGGSVRASSPGVGRGAEFVIRLPALPTAPEEASRQLPASGGSTRERAPARVLVVEDNLDAAESLTMVLELLGHQVRVAHDGMAALVAARAEVPDMMLIDIGLPGMNGYELARAVRRDPLLQHLRLVALTGYGRSEDHAQAMTAGFDHHLVKPVDFDTLEALVTGFGSPGESQTGTRAC
jgi:PAS domain S-box-containing protein